MTAHDPAEDLLETMVRAEDLGLNRGTSGNSSVRTDRGFLITPTAIPPRLLSRADLVELGLEQSNPGELQPSSEWRLHRDLYRSDPAIGAVVHTHSPWATSLSTLRQDLPAVHYTIALAETDTIRCARYATFGTEELSENALSALGSSRACLLANHGLVTTGTTLSHALELAIEIEHLCQVYLTARAAGRPVVLDDREMRTIRQRFRSRKSRD